MKTSPTPVGQQLNAREGGSGGGSPASVEVHPSVLQSPVQRGSVGGAMVIGGLVEGAMGDGRSTSGTPVNVIGSMGPPPKPGLVGGGGDGGKASGNNGSDTGGGADEGRNGGGTEDSGSDKTV